MRCLQPKGLLATEGAVTMRRSHSWPVPALTSAFLEFIDGDGRPFLATSCAPARAIAR